MDAYGAAKQENAPQGDPSAPPDAGAPPMGDPTQQLGGDPEMKSLQLQVQHLEHVLLERGILTPADLITPPSTTPPPPPPPGAAVPNPMGGMPPAGGPPLQ